MSSIHLGLESKHFQRQFEREMLLEKPLPQDLRAWNHRLSFLSYTGTLVEPHTKCLQDNLKVILTKCNSTFAFQLQEHTKSTLC